MKYLKKYNESLSKDEVQNLIYDIEDILIEVDDMNINEESNFIYKVKLEIGPLLSVEIKKDSWENFEYKQQFSSVKKIFDRVIRQSQDYGCEFVNITTFVYDVDGNIRKYPFNSDQYDKLFTNFLTKQKFVIDGEDLEDTDNIYWDKILVNGVKLFFRL